MRDFLTGISIILIVVLTTILVAPYFVDWNGQREFLEARLSHALAQKVTIGGTIDLKLLPTPYLLLDQVVVGGDEAPIKIGVRHLNLELAISPLLHGEFDIVEARLREPAIRITLEPNHSLPTLPAAPAFSADVRFDRIRVEDGTLAIANPESGRTFLVEHLDVDADAASFSGPFKIVGAGGPPDRRTSFRLSTGAAKDGQFRARLSIDENSVHAGVDFDGSFDLRTAGQAVGQSAEGKLVLSGHVPRPDKEWIPWRFSGPLQANPQQARVEGGELRLGSDDAGLTLQADAHATFGEAAKLALDLKAKQLDIDRLSGVPAAGPRAPPQLPDLAELRGILANATPSIPTELGVSVDTATYASETLSGIELRTTLGDAASHPLKVAIDGPGGSHFAATGTLTSDAGPSFSGTLDFAAEDMPRALHWARSVTPTFPWTGRDAQVERLKLAGPVELNDREMSSTHLTARLDRTELEGRVRLAFGSSERSKLTADLKSGALDLDRLPGLDNLLSGSDATDLDLRLDAKAVRVAHFGEGTLGAGRIRMDVGKAGDSVALRDLEIDDLGGASVKAKGDLQPGGGRMNLTLDAQHLDAVAGLVRQLSPGAIADVLVARASAWAPARLDIDAQLGRRAGRLVPTQLAILGNLGETKIDASAKPDPSRSDVTTIAASLRSSDGAAFLHQLGLNTVPIAAIGASQLTVSAHGRSGEPLDTQMDASFGATKVSLAGRFDLLTATPGGSGDLKLQSPDLTPLLQTLAIAFPDMTRRMPAEAKGRLVIEKSESSVSDISGHVAGTQTRGVLRWRRTSVADQPPLTGALEIDRISFSSLVGLAFGPEQGAPANAAWSRQPFAVGLIDPPRAALSLKAKVMAVVPGVEARNATLDLDVAPNTIVMRKLAADVSGGHVEGEAKLRRDGRQATVEGELALDKVHVRIPATLDATVSAKLGFAGGGTSAFSLVSSLAGSGEATAHALQVTGGDPKALARVFDDVEADVLAVDQDAIVRAYNETSRGMVSAGTARFGLRLAAGVVHFDLTSHDEAKGPATSKVDALLDLPQWRLATHVEETLAALPKNWSGSPPAIDVTLDGPLGHPSRSVDVSGFLNAVAARALARESARIEAYELDVRERAFFNARLQSERRREEERQKGEEDARKAEAERKARLEAARQERMRKEQAAKAAREAEEKASRDGADQNARDRKQEPEPRRDGDKRGEDGKRSPAPEPATGEPRDPSALGRY